MSTREGARAVVIAGVYHDLLSKRSLVTLGWVGVADKRLTLDVPFGCALADLPAEVETALRAFSDELSSTTLAPPPA